MAHKNITWNTDNETFGDIIKQKYIVWKNITLFYSDLNIHFKYQQFIPNFIYLTLNLNIFCGK